MPNLMPARTMYRAVYDYERSEISSPYPVVGYNWRGERWGLWVPVEPAEVVKVRPDQTLSRLLADLQIDITDGTYAIVRLDDE